MFDTHHPVHFLIWLIFVLLPTNIIFCTEGNKKQEYYDDMAGWKLACFCLTVCQKILYLIWIRISYSLHCTPQWLGMRVARVVKYEFYILHLIPCDKPADCRLNRSEREQRTDAQTVSESSSERDRNPHSSSPCRLRTGRDLYNRRTHIQ